MPKGYALIYGVSDYSTWGYNNLYVTDDDARSMTALLESQGWEVRLRLDDGSAEGTGPATRTRFETDIQELSAEMNENDRFLFYFSGHGYSMISAESDNIEPESALTGDEWIFLYADNPDWSNDSYLDHTFNDNELGEEIAQLPNSMRIVILDSCYSGGFIGTSPGIDTIPPDYPSIYYDGGTISAAYRAWFSYPGSLKTDILAQQAVVVSAAGEDEYSYEEYENPEVFYYPGDPSAEEVIGHGVFTYHLLKSPQEADDNMDGWITVSEAYEYCLFKIAEEWNADALESDMYLPHLTGYPVDYVLFQAQ